MKDKRRSRASGSSGNSNQRAGTETQRSKESKKTLGCSFGPGLPNPLFPCFLALCAEVGMKEDAARYFD